MYLALSLVILFLLSFLLIAAFKTMALFLGWISKRRINQTHRQALPIGAGVVFILLWFVYILYLYTQHFFSTGLLLLILLPGACILGVSFLDDIINMSAHWRLFIHFLIAVLFMVILEQMPALDFALFHSKLSTINIVLALLALVWSSNLCNFMDGIDGMTALQTSFIFLFGGILFYLNGNYLYALMSLGLLATILGFLVWNWPVAKIFMGDAGSTSLGFFIVVFCILAQQQGISVLLWFMLYFVFFFDATVTLLRRAIHGENLFEGHKNHAFHRLLHAGWSNQKILYGSIVLNSIIAVMVLLAYYHQQWLLVLLIIETALVVAIYLWIERKNPMQFTSGLPH